MTSPKVDRTALVFLALLAFLTLAASSWAYPFKTEVISPRVTVTRVNGVLQTWRDEAASGQALVTLRPGTTADQFQAMLNRQGGAILKAMPEIGMFLVSLPDGVAVVDGAARWSGEAGVMNASPDRVEHARRTPNDSLYAQQWQYPKMNAPVAWDVQTGSATTVVAIIDTGIWITHEDLQGKIWTNATPGINPAYPNDVHGWNFVLNNNDPVPHPASTVDEGASHGTHVAGCVGAMSNNNQGVTGQDWNCKLMPVKVLADQGYGLDSWIIPGMLYAVDSGANVLNMSLGGNMGQYESSYDAPMSYARQHGVVVCVAANELGTGLEYTDDTSTWDSPTCNDGGSANWVFGVAASDSSDKKADFSFYDGSSGRHFIDAAAPGVVILSTVIYDPTHGFTQKYQDHLSDGEEWSGTSMACPQVAGLVALVHAQHPGWDPLTLINQIKATCDNIDAQNPLYAGKLGGGRIDDAAALGYHFPPGPPKAVTAAGTPNTEGGSITVAWSKSADDGKGQKSVVEYTVYRANNKTTNGVDAPDDSTWAAETTVLVGNPLVYLDTAVTNYVKYWYKVSCSDAYGNETFSKPVGPAFAADTLAPVAPSLVYAADTQGDNGGSISISWPGYSTVDPNFAGFRIYRSKASFTNPHDPAVTLIKDLPGDVNIAFYQDTTTVDGTQYWYGITAYDAVGNEDKTVVSVGPVVSLPNFVLTIPQGVSMISVGANVASTDMASLLGIAPADLRLLRWDPTISAYHSYQTNPSDPFLTPAPGRGYWIALDTPITLDLGGIPVTTDPFPINLTAGWNQIGNPTLHDMTWANLHVTSGGTSYTLAQSNSMGFTRDYAWTYDNFSGAYRLVSSAVDFGAKTIAEGAGFWFLAMQNCALTVPAAAPASADTAKPAAIDVTWKIKLTARCGQSVDYDNYLGVSSAAATLNTIVSPPRPSGGPELYFVNQGVDGLAAASFVKPADTASWQARVQVAGLDGQDVEIAWPDLSSLPNNVRPVLTDKSTGKRIYMRTAAAYHFTPSTGEAERAFEVTLAQNGVLSVSSMAARPSGQGVDVAFTLSAAATISGQVLNLSGRVVQELPAATMDAGPCHVQWTGLGRSGARAPSGQYLLRLTARTADGQESSGLAQVRLGR